MAEGPICVAVGSNIEPATHLCAALDQFRAHDIPVVATSRVFRTAPIGRPGQDQYRNCVWRVATERRPRTLKFEVLRAIEASLGRARTTDPYAARTMDLDLLVYGEERIDEPGLQIPDPEIAARPFLAAGLRDVAPDLPLLYAPTVQALLAAAAAGLEVDEALTARLRALITGSQQDKDPR